MKVCFPEIKYKENKSDWFYTLPNGSEIWIGGLDDKERTEKILGNEYSSIFFNECSQISYDSITIAMTRLAENSGLMNKAYYDCNPPSKKHWSYMLFVQGINPETRESVNTNLYSILKMNPDDNIENLPDGYIDTILGNLPIKKRARFRDGLFCDDNDRALWKRAWIDNNRIKENQCPELLRVVIAIDPAVTSKPESDDTGIIVCGEGPAISGMQNIDRPHYYILDDLTLKGTPLEWGRVVVNEYKKRMADRIIGETNNGGDLIAANIRYIDPNVSYVGVHATRGKYVRAEPISALYEQGRVHHVGAHYELEDEMCEHEFTTSEPSPNRLDALVWGMTYLAIDDCDDIFTAIV